MIGIKNTSQDAESAVLVKKIISSQIKDSTARVSRSATLDLGTVIDNQGYAVGDRTIEVKGWLNDTDASKVWTLYKSTTSQWISTEDGLFFGAIERLKIDRGMLEMTFLVKE